MNIKRIIISACLIFILYLLLRFLNNKPVVENLAPIRIGRKKKDNNTNTTPQPISPYGIGQIGLNGMAQNGYYVNNGFAGGYYYGGGQPINVKYIYTVMDNYYPYWHNLFT